MHKLVNVSTGAKGEASAVLIRAAEVEAGLAIVRRRRGGRATGAQLCAGPGKVGQALALARRSSGEDLCAAGGLELWLGKLQPPLLDGPRVGIEFASTLDRKRPWRFANADSEAVSHPKGLRLR